MGKAGYLISRIREMDVGNMVQQAKEVHQRCKKPTLWILADMTLCGFQLRGRGIWIMWCLSGTA